MTKSDKLREFAHKYGVEYTDSPFYSGFKQTANSVKTCLSDLTALISEGYYPKEFVEWKDINCTYLRGSSRYAINECPKTAFGDYVPYTLDELFNYWKENEQ